MAHHTSEQEPVPALALGSALPSSAQPVLQTTSEASAKTTPLHLYPGDSRRPHLLQAAEVTLQRGEPEWLGRPVERSRATLPNLFSYIWTPKEIGGTVNRKEVPPPRKKGTEGVGWSSMQALFTKRCLGRIFKVQVWLYLFRIRHESAQVSRPFPTLLRDPGMVGRNGTRSRWRGPESRA